MKMVFEAPGGRRFFAMKETRRTSDPAPDDVRRTLRRSWLYSDACMRDLVRCGAILRPPFAPAVVLVRDDAPAIAGGLEVGFWKLLQRRFSLKHAVAQRDRAADPELWAEVERWLRTVDLGAFAAPARPLGGGGEATRAASASPGPLAQLLDLRSKKADSPAGAAGALAGSSGAGAERAATPGREKGTAT
eukprot:m51a1_g10992 hypothetical protein (190) ;mRNA; f:333910-334479